MNDRARIAAILVGLAFTGPSSGHADWIERVPPESTLASAWSHLGTRLPSSLIRKYVRVDRAACRYSTGDEMDRKKLRGRLLENEPIRATPYWLVSFRLAVPSKRWVDFPMGIYVDEQGRLLPERSLDRIPDCRMRPELCSFRFDEQGAKEVARKAGLPDGPGRGLWKTSVGLGKGRFQWTITAKTGETGNKTFYRQMVIDCGTGEITANFAFTSIVLPAGSR